MQQLAKSDKCVHELKLNCYAIIVKRSINHVCDVTVICRNDQRYTESIQIQFVLDN